MLEDAVLDKLNETLNKGLEELVKAIPFKQRPKHEATLETIRFGLWLAVEAGSMLDCVQDVYVGKSGILRQIAERVETIRKKIREKTTAPPPPPPPPPSSPSSSDSTPTNAPAAAH